MPSLRLVQVREADAFAINVAGVVVGDYIDADGAFHGYVRTPDHSPGADAGDAPAR